MFTACILRSVSAFAGRNAHIELGGVRCILAIARDFSICGLLKFGSLNLPIIEIPIVMMMKGRDRAEQPFVTPAGRNAVP
jgi:hypothetical protein